MQYDSLGNVKTSPGTLMYGESQAASRLFGGLGANYTQISSNGTQTIKGTPGMFAGVYVIAGGTGSTVSVYDNNSAAGPQLIPTTSATTTAGTLITPLSGGCVLTNTALTVVTAGTAAATINVYWS